MIVDYAAALSTSDLSLADAGGGPGCMSGLTDPECVAVFPRVGLDLATGASDPTNQGLFRVE